MAIPVPKNIAYPFFLWASIPITYGVYEAQGFSEVGIIWYIIVIIFYIRIYLWFRKNGGVISFLLHLIGSVIFWSWLIYKVSKDLIGGAVVLALKLTVIM